MENIRKNRQDEIRKVAKYIKSVENIVSFEVGAKWADFHPYWKEDLPEYEEDKNGLPKLYLCQILISDMTFGYRYSYRVGFINKENKWNIENSNTKVTRYLEIFCDDNETKLINDIEKFETNKNN